jgi:hypothetical protein
LDCRHVCETCAFHDALQAGKQKEVHPPYSPDLAPASELFRHTTYVGKTPNDLLLRAFAVMWNHIWIRLVYSCELD